MIIIIKYEERAHILVKATHKNEFNMIIHILILSVIYKVPLNETLFCYI